MIKNLYIQNEIKNNPYTKIIEDKIGVKPIFIDEINDLPDGLEIKHTLVLANQRGSFLKKCPCTPEYIGCGYYVLELCVGCPFDCSYCYLQQYQNINATIFYVNFDKMFDEIFTLLKENPGRLFRIGNGEYADSMFLNQMFDYSSMIMQELSSSKYKNYMIEFKTKSASIENFLKYKPTGHEVIGWTINTRNISISEEKNTADVDKRIAAMARCTDYGYLVAVHFDPMIYHPNWEDEYKNVVDRLFKYVGKKYIAWISIGSLRFNASLKPVIARRHPESKIIYEEMIRGVDGKMRYLKDVRLMMYKKLVEYIKNHNKDALVYFCMEDAEVWKNVLNLEISTSEDVEKRFKLKFNL